MSLVELPARVVHLANHTVMTRLSETVFSKAVVTLQGAKSCCWIPTDPHKPNQTNQRSMELKEGVYLKKTFNHLLTIKTLSFMLVHL